MEKIPSQHSISVQGITSSVEDPGLFKFLENINNEFKKEYDKVVNKFIKYVAEEAGLSLKCAEYHVKKHFKFEIETNYSEDDPYSVEILLTPRLKSPEEMVYDMDNIDVDVECERELF